MDVSFTDLLGPQGPLAARISGFAPRVQQQTMAEAVGAALAEVSTLIVEAGTGTGKTFAYLLPALLSGQKVIVSTGTKTLQDQLYHRDLPTLRSALGATARVALLKGRANYLCLHRLENAELEPRRRQQQGELNLIRGWSGRTRHGDIAELAELPEAAPIWPQVTSTAENCLGQDCPRIGDCFVVKARRNAQEADLLVVNHHLLCADMALREDGFGELLPAANAYIIDEAHQLAEVATGFFGLSLGSRQLLDLARDASLEQRREAGEMTGLDVCAQSLEKAVHDMRLAFGVEPRRAAWRDVANHSAVVQGMQDLSNALGNLTEWLKEVAPRGKGLENVWQRGVLLMQRLQQVCGAASDGMLHWFETFTRAFALNLTPLDVADLFRERMQAQPSAWIFTSATLAVGESFSHFAAQLGLDETHSVRLGSPFDYARSTLLYLPPALPEPSDPRYLDAFVAAALPVLEASAGRAFLLFTSHRALQEVARRLDGRIPFPLLVQGSLPRAELLDRFRALGNAVLLGTSSFWEGVDVRGAALSCVIIDKLPFASPGDPILQARLEALRERGGNPFMDFQLPAAVIALKQGAGRLIRDVQDSGVLMLCDPRLLNKPYGRLFLSSLPDMPRSRKLEDVEEFFRRTGSNAVLQNVEQSR